LKVLVIGDTHYDNVVKGYLEAQLEATWKIITSSMPQAVIFLGDIFHYRNPDVETFLKVHKFFTYKLNQIPGLSRVIILRGNHDSANKSDDGLTVLESFKFPSSKVVLYKDSGYDCDLDFCFIPHYEKEEETRFALKNLDTLPFQFNYNPIVFGHFGYEGSIYTHGFFNFTIKKEELKHRTILGHIHQFKDDGNVTILGTPWSTNQGEGDYKHYVAEIEREKDKWGPLNLIEVNHGPRHLTVPFQS
jgi:predicted phosphodiesterase